MDITDRINKILYLYVCVKKIFNFFELFCSARCSYLLEGLKARFYSQTPAGRLIPVMDERMPIE